MPSAAAIVSRNPTTALTGTAIERNTTISSSSASPTTRIRNTGRAALSLSEVSMLIAVLPVTMALMPVSSRIASASARSADTRSFVSCDAGLVLGVTVMIATSPVALRAGSETAATLSKSLQHLHRLASRSPRGFSWPVESTTTVSGPVNPGPNASASRS